MSTSMGRMAAVATFAAASVAASAAARADAIVVFDTGVDGGHLVLAPGTGDPHYSIVQVPAGSGFAVPRQATVALAHPVYVPNSAVGTVGSSWIAPLGDTNGFFAPGTYVYRTTFDLTGLDPATAVIDGTVAVDDTVTDVRLNGVSFGAVGGAFVSFATTFHLDHAFQNGVNTIDFVVANLGGSAGPTGLRVDVHGTATAVVPADTLPPAIVGTYDRALSWTGAPITLVAASLGITAVDGVDGSVPVALSPDVVGLGSHVVTATASDAAGNVAVATFNVSVVDVTAPVISGPSSAAPAFDWTGSPLVLTPALLGLSATDDVDGAVAVTLSPGVVGLGSQVVTATATDAAGNSASRSFTVTVTDTTTHDCRSRRDAHDRSDERDRSKDRADERDSDDDDRSSHSRSSDDRGGHDDGKHSRK